MEGFGEEAVEEEEEEEEDWLTEWKWDGFKRTDSNKKRHLVAHEK